jgi:hypothetical protein
MGADDIFAYIQRARRSVRPARTYTTRALKIRNGRGWNVNGRGRNVNGRRQNINGCGRYCNGRGGYRNECGREKIGADGLMTGADGIMTGEDLKSVGSRTEAGTHSITISYKICTHKNKNIIEKLKRK